MLNGTISTYFPSFLWKFWLSNHQLQPKRPRVHTYDVYANELTEVYDPPTNESSIFHQLDIGVLDPHTRYALEEAERTFSRLEREVESILREILDYTVWSQRENFTGKGSLSFSRISVEALRKYFVFLRFRNSSGYQKTVSALEEAYQSQNNEGNVATAFQHVIVQHRLRHVLQEFTKFLNYRFQVDLSTGTHLDEVTPSPSNDKFIEAMDMYCWKLLDAELSFGVAGDEQEFILSERCYGSLEGELEEDLPSYSLFFPIFPTMALYILGDPDDRLPSYSNLNPLRRSVSLDVGHESSIDVFLRNATVLQTYPQYLFFQSLRTVALSISSYEEFRSTGPEHLDYSRLKQRCRQKFLQETVTKTLTVKGSVILTDLTDEVVVIGDSAVCHGSFSDVWKGTWEDPIERRQRVVALKFLRPVMVKGVREKLLQRLQTEVVAWHRLCHKNVSQLFGIVQSPHSIGMVSQWCENGTLSHYLKENVEANGLRLLGQVASGIAHLHQMNIIHGDLKGGNILVDELGNAVITDFGLSKVIEEISDTMNKGTSFFAGSTRWMAPELLFALVEDNGAVPAITTFSDVYAFASVCLEIASGLLPYPHRSNDHAVTVDILRGIRPCRSAKCLLKLTQEGEQALWDTLDQCWDPEPKSRPTMSHMVAFLEVLEMSSRLA